MGGEPAEANRADVRPGERTAANCARSVATRSADDCLPLRLRLCLPANGRKERETLERRSNGSIAVMRYSRHYNPYCEKHREGDGFFFHLPLSTALSFLLAGAAEQSSIDQKMNRAVSAAHFTFPSHFYRPWNKMSLRRREDVHKQNNVTLGSDKYNMRRPSCCFSLFFFPPLATKKAVDEMP